MGFLFIIYSKEMAPFVQFICSFIDCEGRETLRGDKLYKCIKLENKMFLFYVSLDPIMNF